ncbi:unnamed protein product [Ambrosiozyma monospora]|uniref:Unnamed protein product n=1 Tax=Ambrosiozyma monospora TaxID=43982 RepID=A0ACB5TTK4_AMBMO|nr:unnamed protein product [Ambrosiozyma monospora]
MKFQNELLRKLYTGWVPVDCSGCPNITSTLLQFNELQHYIATLNCLQNSKVEKLSLWDLELFPSEDDRIIGLKILVSVRDFELEAVEDPDIVGTPNFKQFSLILPPGIQYLTNCKVPVFPSNIHKVERFEEVKIN